MKWLSLLVLLFCLSHRLWGQETTDMALQSIDSGSFYRYDFSTGNAPYRVLVVIHGQVGKKESGLDAAARYVKIYKSYAQQKKLVLVVPAFDTVNYGGYEGPLGGYRALMGRKRNADLFLNDILDSLKKSHETYDGTCSLVGHSAGGQFVCRYMMLHPERVNEASIIAAGTYMFFDEAVEFPNGLKRFHYMVPWSNPTEKREIDIVIDAGTLKTMFARPIKVVVGSHDREALNAFPGQVGNTRVERANAWVEAAKRYAEQHGIEIQKRLSCVVVKKAGHTSPELFQEAVRDFTYAASGIADTLQKSQKAR